MISGRREASPLRSGDFPTSQKEMSQYGSRVRGRSWHWCGMLILTDRPLTFSSFAARGERRCQVPKGESISGQSVLNFMGEIVLPEATPQAGLMGLCHNLQAARCTAPWGRYCPLCYNKGHWGGLWAASFPHWGGVSMEINFHGLPPWRFPWRDRQQAAEQEIFHDNVRETQW